MRTPHVGLANPEVSQISMSAELQTHEQQTALAYRAPQLFVIGTAVELVQGAGYGSWYDGSSTRYGSVNRP
jgi:hypothetical protein